MQTQFQTPTDLGQGVPIPPCLLDAPDVQWLLLNAQTRGTPQPGASILIFTALFGQGSLLLLLIILLFV